MNKELWGTKVQFYFESKDESVTEYNIVRASNFQELMQMIYDCYGNSIENVFVESLGDILDLDENSYEEAKKLISW